jgi:hypothetical protein
VANGPGDYRDPKVTTTERGGSMKWLWYVLGAILLLLLLAWLLGLLGGEAAEEVQTEDAAVVEETAVTEEPEATEDAAATDAGGEQVVTEEGEPLVTEDGDPIVTEEADE